jgi:MFS family permease
VALGVGTGALLLSAAALLGGRLPTDDDRGRHEVDRRPLLLHPQGLMIWLAFLLGALPALMVLAHAATIAGAAGLGPAASSAAVALLGAGNLAGRTGGGWVSDRIGRVPGLRTATALLAAACVGLAAVTGTGPVLAVLTLVGVSYGAQSSLVPALTADLFGTRRFAANYGQIFTGWGVAGVLGPQAGAWLGDASGGFTTALHLGAASSALALVLYLLMIAHRGSTGDQAP